MMLKKFSSPWIGFAAILIVGGIFRALWLPSIPNGLNRDEVVVGYDAYCVLKTGCDQWGEFLPIFFRGLDGYQPGLFVYSTLPWVAWAGPIDIAIRLTPCLYGILTLLITFLLARRLFPQNTPAALCSVFFLALSPWHIQYSRLANPNILVPFFHTLALLFFFKGLDERKKLYWVLSAAIFGFSFYTYYVAYLFIPLSLLGLLLVFWREGWQRKKELLFSVLLLGILILPLFYFSFTGEILKRAQILFFFDQKDSFMEDVLRFFKNYFFFFSPRFLFEEGYRTGGEWFGRHGVLYWVEWPLVVLAIFRLLRQRTKKSLFLLWWLLIYPIPTSLSGDGHNLTLRTSVAIPIFQLLSGLGASQVLAFLWNRPFISQKRTSALRAATLVLFCLGLLVCVAEFSRKYFIRYPYKYAHLAQYGMKEMCDAIRDRAANYDRIVITGHLSDTARRRPNIFLAYYLPIPPEEYQKMPKVLKNEAVVVEFGKFQVNYRNRIEMPKPGERVLYVVEENECRDAFVHKRIYYPDGGVAYKICEYKEELSASSES